MSQRQPVKQATQKLSQKLALKPWLAKHQLDFSRWLRNGRLPHAILLAAPKGSGKQLLSQWLGQILLCEQPQASTAGYSPCEVCKSCQLQQASTHPDRFDVVLEKSVIGVDTIREVSTYLQTKPQLAQSKFVTIEQADKMTESAANALLKTLEEPNPGNFIVLLCENPDDLLATIISRCRLITLSVPAGEALLQGLGQQSAVQLSHNFLNVSHLNELLNTDIEQDKIKVWQAFFNFLTCFDNHQEFAELLAVHQQGIKWLTEVLQLWLRQDAGWQINLVGESLLQERFTQLGNSYDNEQHWQCLTLFKQLVAQVKSMQQLNGRMSVEKLLLDIEQVYQPKG